MAVKKLAVEIELLTEMLGTAPKNKKIYSDYIATKTEKNGAMSDAEKKTNTAEEIEDCPEIDEKGYTGFLTDAEKGLYIPDYMVRGFLKSACETLQTTGQLKKIPAYSKWLDRLVFTYPRKIFLGKMEPDGNIERPLRGMTPKGAMVALVKSDYISAGSRFNFEIAILENSKGLTVDVITKCLEFGQFVGFGQWRGSGGYGRFNASAIEVE